jgi:hypothetical protein
MGIRKEMKTAVKSKQIALRVVLSALKRNDYEFFMNRILLTTVSTSPYALQEVIGHLDGLKNKSAEWLRDMNSIIQKAKAFDDEAIKKHKMSGSEVAKAQKELEKQIKIMHDRLDELEKMA